MATHNYGLSSLDFCKNVNVVDYALVSSDLFPLISDFAVLDFCEIYSDVHCPIVLKLNLIKYKRQNSDALNVRMMFVLRMLTKVTYSS